jgi:ATP adenylyltransferase/5',5'''-P-1,P-4-tetraphosphate phosphorylase II
MYVDTVTDPSALTPQDLEAAILLERLSLYNRGKSCGAVALRRRLECLGLVQLPSVSTINRILSKNYLTNRRTGYYSEDYC